MTCADAIEEIFTEEKGIVRAREIIALLYERYPERPWQESTIRQHLAALAVNQPSGRSRPGLQRRAFLYWLGSGRYRRWVPEQDGPRPPVVTPDATI